MIQNFSWFRWLKTRFSDSAVRPMTATRRRHGRLKRHSATAIERLEPRVLLSATLTVVDVDSLAIDADSDGVADPGDQIHYTVTVQNTGDASATNLTIAEIVNDPNLTLVPGSLNVSPLAINDTYTAVANTQLVVGTATPLAGPAATVAGNVLSNDTEFLGDTFTISTYNTTSANGGAVNLVTTGPNAGSFTYTPAAGFTGADTFTYTLRDKGIDGIAGNADDLTSVATVTINVGAQKVWYVDNTAGTGGDGTSTNPFDSLSDVSGASGPDGTGDIIYVRSGSGNYTGGVTLVTNQTLWGENTTLIVDGFTLQAAGTDPTITNAAGNGVTLATGNTIKGLTIGDTTGTDISGTAVGSLFITNVNSIGTGGIITIGTSGAVNITLDTATTTSSSTTGISLTNITGSFTASTGAISGVTGTDVYVNGGTATVNIGSSITSNTGGSVEVTGRAAGSNQVTFSGALNITGGSGLLIHDNSAGTVLFSNASKVINTGTSAAINLSQNSGATVNFTGGGLDIDTTSGTGFNADFGGTVNITGTGNSITATTGKAIFISGVTIGSSGITLQSTAANGGTNSAITLADTGTGNFTVTGDGTGAAGAQGGNASGGIIQNITGADAISLSNVGGTVSLSSMSILNVTSSNDATDAIQTISGVDAIQGTGTIGALSLTGVKISNTSDMAIKGTGTWTGLTINNSLIEKSNRYGVANRGDSNNEGMVVISGLTGTASITNSKFDQGGTLVDLMTATSGHLDVTMTNNIFSNSYKGFNGGVGGIYQVGGYGVRLITQGSASLTAIIGDVNESSSALGNLFLNDTYSVFVGHLNGTDTGLIKALLSENTFQVTNHLSPTGAPFFTIPNGTVLLAPLGVGNMDATVSNNTFDQTVDAAGLEGSLSVAAQGGTNNQVKITGNNFINPWDRPLELRSNNGAVLTALVSGNTYTTGTAGGAGTDSTAFTGSYNASRFWTLNNSTLNLTWINETGATNSLANGTRIEAANAGDTLNVFMNNLHVPNGYSFINNGTLNLYRNGSVSGTIQGILQDNNVTGGGGSAATSPPTVSTTGTITFSNTAVIQPSFTIPLLFSPVTTDTGNGTTTTDPTEPSTDNPDGSPLPTDPTDGTTAVVDDGVLTQAELDTLVAAAIARWEATGLTPEQAAALHSVTFVVEDLPPGYLGEATPGVVIVDSNAAGNSWFIDTTPDDDSEFTGVGSDLNAIAGSGAAGRVDALSVIMHELGHQLGLADTYAAADAASVMFGWLQQGERRLPTEGQALGADPNYLVWENGPDFLFGSTLLGTLPAGYNLTIVYDATVNNITNGVAPIVSSQIRVTADGGINVLSDDPSISGAANATQTPIDSIQIGNLVYIDADTSGTFNVGDSGMDGVTVNLYVDVNTNGVLDAGDGAAIATTVTAGGGLYSFGVLPGDYLVEIAAANFQSGGPLEGMISTGGAAIDPDTNIDNDDNGINNASPAVNGISSQAITVNYNTEPTADGTGQFDINNTVDFGFFLQSNTPPVLATAGNINYSEDDPATAIDSGITVTDTDSPTLTGATITMTNFVAGQDVLGFVNDGLTMGNIAVVTNVGGVLTLTSAGGSATTAEWQAALRAVTYANTSNTPDTTPRSVDFVVNDGIDPSNTLTSTINITATNDAPVLATAGNINYAENDPATAIDTGITVTDADNATLTGATITITNFVAGQDVLGFVNDGLTMGNIAVVTNVSGVLTLTSAGGIATTAEWQAALRAVTYTNTSEAPDTTARSVDFVVNDGTDPSNTLTSTINITASNDVPVVANIETTTLPYAPNGPAVAVTSTLTLSDADSPNLTGATVTITGYQAGDVLQFTDTLNITGVFVAGTLTLTGSDTVANYETALRSITYASTSQSPAARTVNFQVTDGTDPSNIQSRTVGGYAQLVGTVLNVYGTPQTNNISVTEGATLDIVVDGALSQFTPASVTAINIYADAGDDSILINSLNSGTALTAYGGDGNDTIKVNSVVTQAVTLDGGNNNDLLIGGSGDDTLIGGQGNDWLNGGDGSDSLDGGAGSDVYAFNDTLTNQTDTVVELNAGGTDQLNFSAMTTAVTVNLTSDATLATMVHRLVKTGSAGQAAFIENVLGGSGNDFITGNAGHNYLAGNGGNDTLIGAEGNDELVGGQGNDLLKGGDQDDVLTGGIGDDYLKGEAGNDFLNGGDGFNTLAGGIGNDMYLFPVATINQLETVIELSAEGTDTLNFSALTTAVVADLTSDTAMATMLHRIVQAGAGQSAFIENVVGGSGNDQINGNAANNLLIGNDGNDTISGNGGNDILVGGNGNDVLKGIGGLNILIGGTGADLLLGGTGEDLLMSGSTVYDNDPVLLQYLLAEWTSGSPYQTRVDHLLGTTAGGANLGITLNSTTAHTDADADYLTGGSGRDWFLAGSLQDVLSDQAVDEVFTHIDTWL